MSGQWECVGCGLSVHDLPDEAGDPETAREVFFDYGDDGLLRCQGCAS